MTTRDCKAALALFGVAIGFRVFLVALRTMIEIGCDWIDADELDAQRVKEGTTVAPVES
jgi:hypothetical protein